MEGKTIDLTEMILNNESSEICTACGGKCCKNHPGHTHAMQFIGHLPVDATHKEIDAAIIERVTESLKSGIMVVDWWEGDVIDDLEEDEDIPCLKNYKWPMAPKGNTYLLRARSVVDNDKWKNPLWGGACAHWNSDTGCSLEVSQRPWGCQALVPREDHEGEYGHEGSDKRASAISWRPYQDPLERVCEIMLSALV